MNGMNPMLLKISNAIGEANPISKKELEVIVQWDVNEEDPSEREIDQIADYHASVAGFGHGKARRSKGLYAGENKKIFIYKK